MDDKCCNTMVGIVDNFLEKLAINCRVRIGQNVGTVKYIGEVIGYSGVWIGVEWDDPLRGKHSGTVNDVKYFQTTKPNSGSMVRPWKINKFESLEDAVRYRYVPNSDNVLDENLLREAQEYCGASIFEIVGMEKIAQKQSHIEKLTEVSVANSNTNCPGNLSSLKSLSTLDLTGTLIWNWETLANIVQQIPTLLSLNISCNRLQLPTHDEITRLEPSFRLIKHINLSKCGLNQWTDIIWLAQLWPFVESLSLQENAIQTLVSADSKSIFKNLQELDLNLNHISNFEEICKLGNIKTLKSLYLMNNGISNVKFEDIAIDKKLDIFVNLNKINLCHNPIDDEIDLFNELDKLASLTSLAITMKPDTRYEETFSNAVALIQSLQVFNKSYITKEDRRGAECDVWKKFGSEWQKTENDPKEREKFYRSCRAYFKLVEKYGSPTKFFNVLPQKASNLIKINVYNNVTGENFEKQLPRRISVQALQGLIIKYFKREKTTPTLKYVDSRHPDLIVELDNVSKTLDYYSIQDGDTVICQW